MYLGAAAGCKERLTAAPLPHYRQLSDQIIDQIQQGYLQSGARLPSTRQLSQQLGIHRKSVVHAYEELALQDWIYTATGRGTFVSEDLPETGAEQLLTSLPDSNAPSTPAELHLPAYMTVPESVTHLPYHLDDGLPMANHDVRMIYLTPHHQYPTTLIMPAARRIQLLEMARANGVYVFEDDYDFDFHYGNVPIMPLASARHDGLLLYAGSFTKAISPAFRVGYLVGNPALIAELTKIRRIVDRQGDPGEGYGPEWNATRLGFASSTEAELREAVRILRGCLLL